VPTAMSNKGEAGQDIATNLAHRASAALSVARARRDIFAEQGVFLGDPAWDVLLCLMAQTNRRNTVTVTALVAATGLSELTVRRTVAQLCEPGIAFATTDNDQGAMLSVGLTPLGKARLLPLLT
jgi:hypothetical protein